MAMLIAVQTLLGLIVCSTIAVISEHRFSVLRNLLRTRNDPHLVRLSASYALMFLGCFSQLVAILSGRLPGWPGLIAGIGVALFLLFGCHPSTRRQYDNRRAANTTRQS